MKYHCPEDEKDLHDLESTMCACGPDLEKDDEGNMLIRHIPFNIQTLLRQAEELSSGSLYPAPAPRNKKKRF